MHGQSLKKHEVNLWCLVLSPNYGGGGFMHRCIPRTKASDTELWCFLLSAPEKNRWVNNRGLVIWDTIALIMTSLWWIVCIWTLPCGFRKFFSNSLIIFPLVLCITKHCLPNVISCQSHICEMYIICAINTFYAPCVLQKRTWHYSDVIMGAIKSQITSLTIICLTVYSDADQRKHQSSASLAIGAGNSSWCVVTIS